MKRKESNLEWNGLISLIMTFLGGGLGSVFQLLCGRVLGDVALYADYNALVSGLAVLSLPSPVVTYVVARYVAEYQKQDEIDNGGVSGLLRFFVKPITTLFVVMLIIGFLIVPFIRNLLRINDSIVITLGILSVCGSVFTSMINGLLQGMQCFFAYGMTTVIGQLFKILGLGATFFSTNKLRTLFAAIFVGTLASFLFGMLFLKGKRVDSVQDHEQEVSFPKEGMLRYVSLVAKANLLIVLLNNFDMILVKYFYSADAGYYSAAVTLAKITTYISSALYTVLFPMAVSTETVAGAKVLLKRTLLYNAILNILAILLLHWSGGFLLRLLYGPLFMGAERFLFPALGMFFVLDMIIILLNFCLAQGEQGTVFPVTLLGILCEGLLFALLRRGELTGVLWIVTSVMMCVFLLNLVQIFRRRGKAV